MDTITAVYSDEGALVEKSKTNLEIIKWIVGSKDGYLLVSRVATLYLVRKGKIRIIEEGQELDFTALLKRFTKLDNTVLSKLLVFENLVNRGYHVTEAYGETSTLLMSDTISQRKKYKIIVVEEGIDIPITDIKNLILREKDAKTSEVLVAIVERRGGITFYSADIFLSRKILEK